MKKTIAALSGAAVVLALLYAFGSPRTGDEAAVGKTADKTRSPAPTLGNSFDFGRISMKAGRVSHRFLITASSTPRTIMRISTSCMCTEAFLLDADGARQGPFGMAGHGALPVTLKSETVAPGESRILEVVFDPAAHGPAGVGAIERAVVVEGEGVAPEIFGIKAFVTP